MTIEEQNQIQPEVDEIEVEVTESEQQDVAAPSSDDELENYTKGVSKRINKVNAKRREAEEKAARLEQELLQKDQQVQQYYNAAVTYQQNLLAKEEEAVQVKEREADQLYKKAHESGDADLISKADSLKNDVSIQKEKVRIAKQRQQEINTQSQQVYQGQQQSQNYQQQPQETPVQPTQEALEWKSQNNWYGEDVEATQYAQYTHMNLVNEGFEPDSNEYYSELNQRVYKVYPGLQSGNAEQSEERPAVQRVASASVGGRQKTQGKKNGVQFSKTEVARLRGLKPHGMSEEAWLKSVAKEKQRIQSREAK
tara:strand:- start:520 stop:1449 length:930 start_codon:yes stop_codon:yes gene_type:complete